MHLSHVGKLTRNQWGTDMIWYPGQTLLDYIDADWRTYTIYLPNGVEVYVMGTSKVNAMSHAVHSIGVPESDIIEIGMLGGRDA